MATRWWLKPAKRPAMAGPRMPTALYQSEKVEEYGEFVNQRIVLRPQTNAFGYRDIVLEDNLEDLKVIGVFLSVL